MKRERSAVTYLRWAIILSGMALPTLTLVPFGSIWLWQNGYLVPWAIGAFLLTCAAYVLQRRLLGGIPGDKDSGAPIAISDDCPDWTPAEISAWTQVETLAAKASPEDIASRDAAIALAIKTVKAVAASLHPERPDPLWQFTAPEALALIERVAGRMKLFIEENVPLGDRLTVAQMLALYSWRGLIEVTEKAYDVWRAVRLLNPVTAATSELRERLSKKMLEWGRDHLARQLARTYVEEVGRAAIDLYGGRLKVESGQLAGHITGSSQRDLASSRQRLGEPLRMLVAGQVGVGKSSLVNALGQEAKAAVDALPATTEFAPYEFKRDGLPTALLIDSPGLGIGKQQQDKFIERAAECDLVLWVCAANRPDREIDRWYLQALRQHFADRPNRRRPPTLLILSHIDRLRPFQEWQPPYDLTNASNPKAASIRAAVEAAGADLGFPSIDIIPVCLEAASRYNIDALWAKIAELLPEAQRAQLVRTLRDAGAAWDWKRIWMQAKGGGRVLARAMTR
jgi:predicted GTPase